MTTIHAGPLDALYLSVRPADLPAGRYVIALAAGGPYLASVDAPQSWLDRERAAVMSADEVRAVHARLATSHVVEPVAVDAGDPRIVREIIDRYMAGASAESIAREYALDPWQVEHRIRRWVRART